MKIADIGLKIESGRIIMGECKANGNMKAGGIDITEAMLKLFMQVIETPEGRHMVHRPDKDTLYSIKVKKYTAEEIAEYDRKKIEDKARSEREFQQLLLANEMFFKPYQYLFKR